VLATLDDVWALTRPSTKVPSSNLAQALGAEPCSPGCPIEREAPGAEPYLLVPTHLSRWALFAYAVLQRAERCSDTSHESQPGLFRDDYSWTSVNYDCARDDPGCTGSCEDDATAADGGWLERNTVLDPIHDDRIYVIDRCGRLEDDPALRPQTRGKLPLRVMPDGLYVDLPNCGRLATFDTPPPAPAL
jgi:hypothetical protein